MTFTSENYSASIIIGSLSATNWDDDDWVKNLKKQLMIKSFMFNTVLIFDKSENTPNVSAKGMDYSFSYDKYMIAGYWVFPSGIKKFCWGGVDSGNNFKHCSKY